MPLLAGELAEEVLVDPAEHVVAAVVVGLGEADRADQVDELPEATLVEALAAVVRGSTPRMIGFSFSIGSIAASMSWPMLGLLGRGLDVSQRASAGTQKTFWLVYSSRSSRNRVASLGFGM